MRNVKERRSSASAAWLEPLEGRVFMSASPKVVAPHATVLGKSLGDWSAEWLKWALSQPASISPLLDTTGQFAGVGQDQKVFFLAGTFGVDSATRNVTVPTGTHLFFPVINQFWVTVEGTDPPFETNEPNIRADFAAHNAALTGVFATIDGQQVPNILSHIEEDPPGGFQIDFPADNVFGLDPSILGTSAESGVYLMLNPLTPGQHTIEFGGTDPIFNFTEHVTYNINVIPKGQYDKLPVPQPPPPGGEGIAAKFSAGPSIASGIFGKDTDLLN